MNPKRPFGAVCICITLMAVPLCQAQTATGVLDSLVAIAHEHNPSLHALYVGVETLKSRPNQIASFADPQVEVQWQALPLETASGPVRSQWHLRQPLPRFGAPALKRKLINEQAVSAEASAGAHVLMLNLRIKLGYIDLYRIAQLERLLDEYEDRITGFVDAARAQYAVATGTQAALLRIQLEKNMLQAERLRLRAAKDTQSLALTQFLGIDLGELPVVSEWPLPEALALDDQGLFAVALKQRPELHAFASEMRQSDLGTELARTELWPALGAGVTWMDIQSNAAGARGADALGIRVSASIPLSRRQTHARIREAVLIEEEISARKRAFLQELKANISTLVTQYSELLATIALFDDGLIPQADIMLNTTLSAYAAGQASFLDLLEAERMRYSLDGQRVEAAISLLRTAAELERTIGIASWDDLHTNN